LGCRVEGGLEAGVGPTAVTRDAEPSTYRPGVLVQQSRESTDCVVVSEDGEGGQFDSALNDVSGAAEAC
jgi:hypothetical protein